MRISLIGFGNIAKSMLKGWFNARNDIKSYHFFITSRNKSPDDLQKWVLNNKDSLFSDQWDVEIPSEKKNSLIINTTLKKNNQYEKKITIEFFQSDDYVFIREFLLSDDLSYLFLCVKPKDILILLENWEKSLSPFFKKKISSYMDEERLKRNLLISVTAGITLDDINARVKNIFCIDNPQVLRIMPNTPVSIGQGVITMSFSKNLSQAYPERMKNFMNFMSGLGEVHPIEESQMDAVTALSGSGPAYVLMMLESMINAGLLVGLPHELSKKLAIQSVLGAASLLKEKNNHPALLRDEITSPGGTTIAGIEALEKNQFRNSIIQAIKAAYNHSQKIKNNQ